MPSSPIPAPRPRPRSRQTLLVVPQVLNDSTTLLQKSPTSIQEDEETFRAVISSTTSVKDKSAQKSEKKGRKKGEKKVETLKGGLTLVTLDSEGSHGIAKTAVFSTDDEEDEVCDENERIRALQEDKAYSEWVRSLFCFYFPFFMLWRENENMLIVFASANFLFYFIFLVVDIHGRCRISCIRCSMASINQNLNKTMNTTGTMMMILRLSHPSRHPMVIKDRTTI